MRMSSFRQEHISRPRFSVAEIERYFFPEPISKGAIYACIFGGLLIISAVGSVFAIGWNLFQAIFVVLGGILLFIGWSIIHNRSNPTDQQYDDWLERKARSMIQRALWTLDLHESQVTNEILCVHSFVLPGSPLAINYRNNVEVKQGKDGRWRSSVNLYTYFFPASHYLAIFTSDVNVLDSTTPRDDRAEEYFYRDIIAVTLRTFQDYIMIDGEECIYRLQELLLKISNGDTIPVGAYVSAIPLDNRYNTPLMTLEETGNDSSIVNLRRLLRFKIQRGM